MEENGIADEMQPDTTGSVLSVKMKGYCFDDLLLQIAEVFALRGDTP